MQGYRCPDCRKIGPLDHVTICDSCGVEVVNGDAEDWLELQTWHDDKFFNRHACPACFEVMRQTLTLRNMIPGPEVT